MRLRLTRVDRTLPLPSYATAGAAAFDLACRETTTIEPHAVGYVPANIIAAVPDGYVLIVALRSSTPGRTGLICPHGIGVIDRDYCGPEDEIKIQVYNMRGEPAVVKRGERIAQAMLLPAPSVEIEEGPTAGQSRGGFGSTG